MAPTSSPRVGWAATSASGLPEISRAMTTFCWLPPDSERASVVGVPPRTSNSVSSRLATSAIRRSDSRPHREPVR